MKLDHVRQLVAAIKRCTQFGVRAMTQHGQHMIGSSPNRNLKRRLNRIFHHLSNAQITANEVLTEYLPVEMSRNPRRRRYRRRRRA